MFSSAFKAGLHAATRHKGLAALLYGLNLALALVLAVPIYAALNAAVGLSGFGPELAAQFDIVLWWDVLEDVGGQAMRTLGAQLFWMIPLYLVWTAAAGVGLIHALRDGGVRSFWQGVGRYTGPALVLGLLFLAVLLAWFIATGLVVGVLSAVWDGEVGTFWTMFVILPTLLITGLAIADLMQDYARMALVIEGAPVLKAWRRGMTFPLRHGTASWLYLAWFAPAALLILLPSVFEMSMGGVWTLFFLQQVFLILRAAVSVGWIGSEVALFERIRHQALPLIADEEAFPEAPFAASSSLDDGLTLA